MAHQLTIREDGRAEMAYLEGVKPWHGLGQELPEGASIEEWAKAAGMDFSIEAADVRYRGTGRSLLSMPERQVLYRSDTQAPLSVVSDSFKVVQPERVLQHFDDLAKKAGFTLETAGTLFGGTQYWGMAKIGAESHILDKKNVVKGRLLMATSVDYSLPTLLKFVAECVVCHNTLTIARSETGASEVRVRHRRTFNPDEVNEKLGIMGKKQFAETINQLRKLANTAMTPEQVAVTTLLLMKPDAPDLNEEALTSLVAKNKPMARITQLAVNNTMIGSQYKGMAGTAWGWLNSVTQYVDHETMSRSADWRMSRAWFGVGDKLKSRALDMATDSAWNVEDRPLAISDGAVLELLTARPSTLGQPREDIGGKEFVDSFMK